MSNLPFRFVHASDFHLEQVPQGLSEVPDHLKELFIEAAYWAAERVFETVLAEEAEMLLLAGDILHPAHTGPRGPLFLSEQFARLAERNIAVYWAGGRVDPPDVWPTSISLPENVHVFPQDRVEEFVHKQHDIPIARIVGVSRRRQRAIRARDFEPDRAGLFTIALAHGTADPDALEKCGIHYWALGGRHARTTLFSSPQTAHYPGSPQGRCPDEDGIHGCTLVQVDEQGRGRTSPIPTDAMRWLNERVVVDEETTRDDLEMLLRERMHTLIESAPGTDLLISWTVAGSGPLLMQLRQGQLGTELLEWLRNQYGFGPPAAWTVSFEVEPTLSLPPEWYEQETIRGDFLREIRQLQVNAGEPLGLQTFVDQEYLADVGLETLEPPDTRSRDRILREAALLGAELLGGEEDAS